MTGWLSRLFPMTRGARYSVVFLFLLSVALAAANLFWTAHEVNSTISASQKATAAVAEARATADAQAALCRAANAARAEQVDLWTFIIHLSKPPKAAAQRHVLAEFEHHLRVIFAPRPCPTPRPGG